MIPFLLAGRPQPGDCDSPRLDPASDIRATRETPHRQPIRRLPTDARDERITSPAVMRDGLSDGYPRFLRCGIDDVKVPHACHMLWLMDSIPDQWQNNSFAVTRKS